MTEDRNRARKFYGFLTPFVQRSRLRSARKVFSAPGKVLDVGCGWTDLPGQIENYTGCDRDPLVLAVIRERYPVGRFFSWDVDALDAPESVREAGPFDTILALAVLEHVKNPGLAMARMASLLSSSGILVVTTPHPAGHLILEAGAFLRLLSPHAHDEHEELLSKARLESLGAKAGLRVKQYRRFLLGFNQLAVFCR